MLPPSARKLKRHRRQHGAVVQHTLRDIKHCVPDPLPAVVRCRAGRSKRSVESSALQSERRILGSSPVGLGPSPLGAAPTCRRPPCLEHQRRTPWERRPWERRTPWEAARAFIFRARRHQMGERTFSRLTPHLRCQCEVKGHALCFFHGSSRLSSQHQMGQRGFRQARGRSEHMGN